MEIIQIPHPGFGMEKIRIRDKHWVLVLFHGNAVSCGFLQILLVRYPSFLRDFMLKISLLWQLLEIFPPLAMYPYRVLVSVSTLLQISSQIKEYFKCKGVQNVPRVMFYYKNVYRCDHCVRIHDGSVPLTKVFGSPCQWPSKRFYAGINHSSKIKRHKKVTKGGKTVR